MIDTVFIRGSGRSFAASLVPEMIKRNAADFPKRPQRVIASWNIFMEIKKSILYLGWEQNEKIEPFEMDKPLGSYVTQ